MACTRCLDRIKHLREEKEKEANPKREPEAEKKAETKKCVICGRAVEDKSRAACHLCKAAEVFVVFAESDFLDSELRNVNPRYQSQSLVEICYSPEEVIVCCLQVIHQHLRYTKRTCESIHLTTKQSDNYLHQLAAWDGDSVPYYADVFWDFTCTIRSAEYEKQRELLAENISLRNELAALRQEVLLAPGGNFMLEAAERFAATAREQKPQSKKEAEGRNKKETKNAEAEAAGSLLINSQ